MVTIIISVPFSLIFEVPFMTIEKLLLFPSKKERKKTAVKLAEELQTTDGDLTENSESPMKQSIFSSGKYSEALRPGIN